MVLLLALLSLLIWLYLLALRGGFWRADARLPAAPLVATPLRVVAVVPARDEEATVAEALGGLLAQEGAAVRVVLVDDHSQDRTGAIAATLAAGSPGRLAVAGTAPLPPGWTGKLWALAEGVRVATALEPDADYLLLTDADVVLGPGTLARLLAKAERERLDLVSLMVELDHRGPWGSLLIPAFVFFFQKLYPFRWVAEPRRRAAAAAGGCILLRPQALARAGGLDAVRDALIDDCALAARIKGSGGRIWLGLADSAVSLRDNRRLSSIRAMVARTAYTQLRHSPLLLAGTLIGMAITYLVPPAVALGWPVHGSAPAAIVAAVAWLLMAAAYHPTLTRYRQSAVAGLLLPLAGLAYGLMTAESAVNHWRGRGGLWKGRVYPAVERGKARGAGAR